MDKAILNICENSDPSLSIDKELQETQGIWEEGDAVEYLNSIRNEWEDR